MKDVLVSRKNKMVAVPATSMVRTLFPEAKFISKDGEQLAVLKHGLAEYVLLRRIGFTLPNPMALYYDWGGGQPFKVQKITCSTLVSNPRAYVLNGMGTGKTRAALWAWDYLYTNGYAGKLLVVAPLSTLSLVWASEVFAVLPHRKTAVLHGSAQKRAELLAQPDVDVYVINHDGLKIVQDLIAARPDIDVMVLDELAVYRNLSQRTKRMVKFVNKFKFAWGLTGSPMPNEPTDVWSQCKIVTPHTVPKYATHARDILMKRESEHVWIPKPNAVDTAFSWMQPSVRFSIDDVVELPDLITQYIDVPLSKKQAHVYKELARDFMTRVDNHEITAVNAGVAMGKLLQVSAGYIYTKDKGIVSLEPEDRLSTLYDLCMAATGKVIVFCAFKHTVYGISTYLGNKHAEGGAIDHAWVNGDTQHTVRNQIFNLFQNTKKYKVIVAHPQCMAHGLTLTAADTIIWYGPIPDLEIYDQANARIRRIGQTKKQFVIHLQGTPVEKKIYRLLRAKQAVQNRLLEMFEGATTSAQEQAL